LGRKRARESSSPPPEENARRCRAFASRNQHAKLVDPVVNRLHGRVPLAQFRRAEFFAVDVDSALQGQDVVEFRLVIVNKRHVTGSKLRVQFFA
jgi:hypothetical protein